MIRRRKPAAPPPAPPLPVFAPPPQKVWRLYQVILNNKTAIEFDSSEGLTLPQIIKEAQKMAKTRVRARDVFEDSVRIGPGANEVPQTESAMKRTRK